MSEADKYIKNYFEKYAGVAAYKEKVLEAARKDKVVRTLFGRLRRFPDIDTTNKQMRAMWERTAFNTVFQGTAADLIKIAMIKIQKNLEEKFPDSYMILQVHDELVFEVKKSDLETLSHMVRQEMEHAAEIGVPLKVDIGHGPSWGAAH